jgi:hypothetical protein
MPRRPRATHARERLPSNARPRTVLRHELRRDRNRHASMEVIQQVKKMGEQHPSK